MTDSIRKEDLAPEGASFELPKELVEQISAVVEEAIERKIQSKAKVPDAADLVGSERGDIREKYADIRLDRKTDGIAAARFIRSVVVSATTRFASPVDVAKHLNAREWQDKLGETVVKAVAASDFDSAGFLIPPQFAEEIIDLLRPQTVIRRAGAQTVPMPGGSLTLPKTKSGTNAFWVGEGQNIGTTQPSGEYIHLSAKKLATIVDITSEMLDAPTMGGRVEQWIRDQVVRDLRIAEDSAFLRGAGTEYVPRGLRNWAASSHVVPVDTSVDEAVNLNALRTLLDQADVPEEGRVWIISPRTRNHLQLARDATSGQYLFPDFVASSGKTLWGMPVFVTSLVPNNLGTGSDESEIYLVHGPSMIIGETGEMRFAVSDQAAFEADVVKIRFVTRVDFAVKYPEAVAVMTGVKWGA